MGKRRQKGIVFVELKRAFQNKYILFAVCIGFAISLWQTLDRVLPVVQYLDMDLKGGMPLTVFNKWMGGDLYSLQGTLYYIIVPLLCAIPFGASFYQDRKNGYLKNVFIRTDRRKYYFAKYIAVFLSGGVTGVIPLLFNFLSTALLLPCILPEITTGEFSVFGSGWLPQLFYTNAYLFLLIFLLIDFVFFGLLSTIALAAGQYMENYFVVLLTPFLYTIVFMFLTRFLGVGLLSIQTFLMPSQGAEAPFWYVCVLASLLAIVTGILFFIKRKKDVY